MYIGLDFLIDSGLKPYLTEVNVGLPGGAEEYDRAHQVYFGKPSDVFERIEALSQQVSGESFRDYLHALPFIESLKPFKLWMDGQGSLPRPTHPGLRLEDKWIQYTLLRSLAPMSETMVFDPKEQAKVLKFLERKHRLILKRRLGRGGRGLAFISDPAELAALAASASGPYGALLQEYVESKVGPYTFSLRAIAFGGEFICMYANLARGIYSNHGVLAYVAEGDSLRLSTEKFETVYFNQKSWEAKIWFDDNEPAYLRHNLYEDEVARVALLLPSSLLAKIKALSVGVERLYDGLDFAKLPEAWFEKAVSS
jgi:hypothetical protein